MNRDAYLSQRDVAGFVEWAGHLVRGEWGLEHSWKGQRAAFSVPHPIRSFSGLLVAQSGGRRPIRRYDPEI